MVGTIAIIGYLVVGCSGDAPTAAGLISSAENAPPAFGEAPSRWRFPAADGYRVNGYEVDRTAFEALRAELDVAAEPETTAQIVNEDGRYGGYEASYRATHRASGAVYSFTEVTFAADGKTRTLHSIQTR